MTARKMYRYEVPIDDEQHVIALDGNPVAVAAQTYAYVVEFWAEHTDGERGFKRTFQVIGTGMEVPEDGRWVGTCPRTVGFVWHLYEIGHGQP